MKLPYKCPLCSRTFRTPQGRRGHLTFKHGQGKRSIYTDAIGEIIGAYKEGIEDVKKKRKKLPRSVLAPEKKAKALAFARELEGIEDGYELKNTEEIEFRNKNGRRREKEGRGRNGRSSRIVYDVE